MNHDRLESLRIMFAEFSSRIDGFLKSSAILIGNTHCSIGRARSCEMKVKLDDQSFPGTGTEGKTGIGRPINRAIQESVRCWASERNVEFQMKFSIRSLARPRYARRYRVDAFFSRKVKQSNDSFFREVFCATRANKIQYKHHREAARFLG